MAYYVLRDWAMQKQSISRQWPLVHGSRSALMRRLKLMLVILALLLAGVGEASADYTLLVSRVNTRESAVPLAGGTLTGDVYIFVSPSTGIYQASFWLD